MVQKEEDRYLLPFSKRGAFETEERMTQFDRIRHYYVAFSRAQNLLVLKTSGNPNDWFEPNFSLVSLMNQSFRSNTHFPKKLFRFPRKKTKRCFNGIFLHEKEIKKITVHFDKIVDKIKQKRFDVKNPPERHICKDCDFKHFVRIKELSIIQKKHNQPTSWLIMQKFLEIDCFFESYKDTFDLFFVCSVINIKLI